MWGGVSERVCDRGKQIGTEKEREGVCAAQYALHAESEKVYGVLRLVESNKSYISFAKEPYQRDYILQKIPIISSILLTVATPYLHACTCMQKKPLYCRALL